MAGVTNGSARVLIVDDKADIRSIVATRLRIEAAFDVVGEAVIPILRSLAPRLRILVFSAYAGAQQRLRPSERPDAEVRKGTGLTPLVKELHRLVERTPTDLVRVDLGIVDVELALRASHAWARLNPAVREVA